MHACFYFFFFISKIIIPTRFCVRFFRFPSLKISKEIWLRKCQLYSVELLIKQSGGNDCASVRMKLPNGTYKGLITAAHTFWVKPGKWLHVADATERRHPSWALKLSLSAHVFARTVSLKRRLVAVYWRLHCPALPCSLDFYLSLSLPPPTFFFFLPRIFLLLGM